jgi:hypothetical protein
MILIAGALLALPPPALSERPIWELNDSQLCEAAHQVMGLPSSNVADVPTVDFGDWEIDCEARVLRIPMTVLDPRLDPIIVERFTRPPFCDEPNLVMFWNRGWHFEVRFRFTDGSTELTRPCEGASTATVA